MQVADLEIDQCDRCAGIWFDAHELDRVLQQKSIDAPIHIDTCAICGGQWLDGGELEVLRRDGFSGSLKRLFNWILDFG